MTTRQRQWDPVRQCCPGITIIGLIYVTDWTTSQHSRLTHTKQQIGPVCLSD
jgi:hypothetical protein